MFRALLNSSRGQNEVKIVSPDREPWNLECYFSCILPLGLFLAFEAVVSRSIEAGTLEFHS